MKQHETMTHFSNRSPLFTIVHHSSKHVEIFVHPAKKVMFAEEHRGNAIPRTT
jgi:hypothetical protein